MEQIYYGIAAVVYSIFLIRFILSWIGGDFDLDADADLDLGDVVSFKGFTHFLMGLSGWLSVKSLTTHNVEWYDYLIGFVLGLIFVIILFFLYKFMFKLEHKPTILSNEELVGCTGKIFLVEYFDAATNKFHCIVNVNNNNGTVEVPAISDRSYAIGETVKLESYNGIHFILNN